MEYESLENEIQNENVEIVYMKFNGNLKGLYGDNVIAIDSRLDTLAEKSCILAEEIGHYYKTYGNIKDLSDIKNKKQEKIARNWAYEKLVGINGLINSFNSGAKSRYDIAESMGITEDFLDEALNHYKEKYGLYYQIDNYTIYFDPLRIIKMF